MKYPLRRVGGAFIIFGIGGAVYFFAFFDTSVPTPVIEFMGRKIGGGRVHNLGLMSERQNGMIFSIAGAGLGALLTLVGRQKPAGRKCPHCAEEIQPKAKICRFCQRDVPPVT